jgi:hypothetical protein
LLMLLSSCCASGLCAFPCSTLIHHYTHPSILHLTYCCHLGSSWTCPFPPVASFCAGVVRIDTPSELLSLNLRVPLLESTFNTAQG